MDFEEFKTGKDDEGRRLDKVVRIFAPELPLNTIYKSLRKGLIKINGTKTRPEYKIQSDDVIQVAKVLLQGNLQEKQAVPVEKAFQDSPVLKMIVFENEHFLILNKPAGLNVHSSRKNQPSLEEYVTQYYKNTRNNTSLSFKPGPLHRIDRYTQGLVCFSMSIKGAQWFGKNMADHMIKKTYYAVVEGIVNQTETWNDMLENTEEKGISRDFHKVKIAGDSAPHIQQPQEKDKECITTITPVKTFKKDSLDLTYAQFNIETGRHHQIRAQSAFHGHPLHGDTAYGGHKTSDYDGEFFLFAAKIDFPQNDLGLPQTIEIKDI